jgi:NAD(P)-dependent dehydrogenase (short-subunit alcohol dehydrogenase family)
MSQEKRLTALVTGAATGIGLETCRALARLGYLVVLTARRASEARRAALELRGQSLDVRAETLDVSQEGAAAACAERLRAAGIHVDVLVNNAAIYPPGALLKTSPETLRETCATNLFGAVWTCQAFVPAMIRDGYGRVVNVSSGSGSFAEGLDGPAAYSLSKAALNALTLKLASEVRGDVKVNSVCPGWVRTKMGGANATRSVEEGADTIVWLATLPARGPSGGFFRDRKQIPW